MARMGHDGERRVSPGLSGIASDLPAAVLARMLGIHITVAVAWQRACAETGPPTPQRSAAAKEPEMTPQPEAARP